MSKRVGFLWRKTFANCINFQQKDDDDRCLVLALELSNHTTVNLISVYFSCFVPDVNYSVELGHYMRFIEYILYDGSDAIILCDGKDAIIFGVTNCECSLQNSGFIQCSDVLNY